MKIKTIDLNKSNKNSFDKGLNDAAIVLVHADWCDHCKDFMPDWKEAVDQFEGMDVMRESMLGTVEEKNLGHSKQCQNVGGFPTIMSFRGGKRKKDYGGPRNLKGISKFIKKKFGILKGGGKLPCGCPETKGGKRKRRGSGNEPPKEEKEEGQLKHITLTRPRMTRRRRRPRTSTNKGPEIWQGGRRRRKRKTRKRKRKTRKRKKRRRRGGDEIGDLKQVEGVKSKLAPFSVAPPKRKAPPRIKIRAPKFPEYLKKKAPPMPHDFQMILANKGHLNPAPPMGIRGRKTRKLLPKGWKKKGRAGRKRRTRKR